MTPPHPDHPGDSTPPRPIPTAMTSPGIVRGSSPGEMIGPYKLLELIGEGGFGYVWRAERREPFVQRVALKVIKPGMDSRGVLARFDQERQALAVMDHPNVARVVDGGLTSPEQGLRPYFVMEYVKGEPITTYCDRNRLSLRERLKLFIPVCEAVQHAHHKGIIHRDIKPSNVLVTVVEGRAAAKVIDFGVAKAMSHTLTEHSILTEHGQLIGTPEYMSPEQAEMGGTDIDTRTDVYSLGVLLYELLTGRLPFESATLRAAALDEVRRIIREQEPPKPSTRLTTLSAAEAHDVASRRQSDTDELARTLRRELDWIPLKAMRKDRARRYTTPGAIAEDIQRYLDDKPIEAAPESRAYLLKKFVRRYRGGIIAAGAVAAALLLGVVVSLAFMTKAELRRIEAEEATKEAQRQTIIAEQRYNDLANEKSRAERVAEMMALLARAQQELHAPISNSYSYVNYYDLVRKLDTGYIEDSPEADFAIRQAFAATVTKSTDSEFHEDANRALAEGIESARALYGPTHATVLELLRAATSAAAEAGMVGVAERWATDRFNGLRQRHPKGHADVVNGLIDLANVVALGGEHQRSGRLLEEAMRSAAALSPPAFQVYDRAFSALSNHYTKLERHEERTRLILEYVQFQTVHERANTEDVLILEADSLERVGYLEGARACWELLVDHRERTRPEGDWPIDNARSRLGGVLLAMGRFAEAEPLLTASALALRGSKDAYRSSTENRIIEAFDRVATLYRLWNQAEPDDARMAAASEWQRRLEEVRAEEEEVTRKRVESATRRGRATELNTSAWNLVRFGTEAAAAGADLIHQAIEHAMEAVSLADDAIGRAHYLNTLGVAQFRLGRYADALDSLSRSNTAYLNANQSEQLANWVFIAMAHRRIGQHDQAAAARAQYELLRGQFGQLGPVEEHSAWHAEFLAEFGLSE